MVFGAMRDKDVSEIASTLFPLAGRVVLTKSDNPRCFEPAELARSVPDEVASEIHLSDNVAEALRIAKEMTPDDGLVVVTGSLYLVGEARKILAAESQI
jgi:dihydrofolate synthase/folylpolyglutamate synthase